MKFRKAQRPSTSPTKLLGYVRLLTRSVWLQSVWQLLPGKFQDEKPKVAVYHSRKATLIRSVIHLLPLGAGVALVVMNLIVVPLYDYKVNMSTSLQFAAKVLEISMQASLADVFLGVVRQQLLQCTGIPLGTLFGPLQTTNIAYLWSIEFWGSISATWASRKMKILSIVVTILIVVLAALVGPSAAVLIIPRVLTFRENRGLYMFDQPTSLFPERVGLAEFGPGINFVPSDFQHAIDGMALEYMTSLAFRTSFDYTDNLGERTGYLAFPDGYVGQVLPNGQFNLDSIATAPMGLITTAYNPVYTTHGNALAFSERFGADFWQPVVHINCTSASTYLAPEPNSTKLSLNNVDPSFNDRISSADILDHAWSVPNTQDGGGKYSTFVSALNSSADQPQQHSALLLFGTQGDCRNETANMDQSMWYFDACVIDAAWGPAPCDFAEDSGLTTRNATHLFADEDIWKKSDTKISLSAEFVENMTLVARTAATKVSFAFSQNLYVCPSGIDVNMVSLSMAMALSSLVPFNLTPNAASPFNWDPRINVIPYVRPTTAQFEAYQRHLRAQGTNIDDDMASYTSVCNTTPFTDITKLTPLLITAQIDTYGYSSGSTTVVLCICVITSYCLIAFTHIVYNLITGATGTSWDSISEVFMLALNSKQPDHIVYTSAGVSTIATFKEEVKVRANKEGSLEVVFRKEGGGLPNAGNEAYQDVEPNHEY